MSSTAPDVLCSYWTFTGPVDPEGDTLWSPWPIEDRVATAADVGFTGIGLWHDDVEHLLEERALADLSERLDAHGIEYVELEFLDDWFVEPGRPARAASDERRARLFAAADALGADHLKVGNLAQTPCPIPDLAGAFEALAADAAAHDLAVALELTSGDVNLDSLDEALTVVENTVDDNGGLLLDVWHLGTLGVTADELRALPEGSIVGVELNDGFSGTGRSRTAETLHHRQLPGAGAFDVAGYVEAARDVGFDGPWGVEILNEAFRALPMAEAYRQAYEAAVGQLSRRGSAGTVG